MADERAKRIERIQRLERIREMEAQQFPGVDAIGVTDGPTPAAQEKMAQQEPEGPGVVMGTLGAVAKTLDAPRGAITGPALAAGLEALTGKDVYRSSEQFDAVNPTNISMYPSANELYERAGVPQGAKVSDYVGGFAEPSEDNPWYRPEKGGLLDVTVRGAGGFGTDMAIDPLNYLSLGGAGLAKKALTESAAATALKNSNRGVIARGLDMAMTPVKKVADIATTPVEKVTEILSMAPGGSALTRLAGAPSRQVKKLGERLYSGPLQAVEHEGVRYGKSDVASTMYRAGIKTPLGLRAKVNSATDALMDARNSLLSRADEAGGQLDMNEALKGARAKIQDLRAIKDPDAMKMADDLENQLDSYIEIASGTPDIPSRTLTSRGVVGKTAYGDDILGDVSEVIPGKKGIAPRPYTPSEGSALKSFLYEDLPTSTFQQNLSTPIGARIKASLAKGIKEGTENATERALGPRSSRDLKELNEEAGKLLATRKAQERVQNQMERVRNNISSVTGTDGILAGVGAAASGAPSNAGMALLMKKGLDAVRLGTMPMGYGLQTLAEGEFTGPTIDALTRQYYKDTAGRGSAAQRSERGEIKKSK